MDRVVGTLCNSLAKIEGYNCFFAYFNKVPHGQPFEAFERQIQIDIANFFAQLTDFLITHEINRIVISTVTKQHVRFLLPAIKQAAKNIPVYFWFHEMPCYELVPLNPEVAIYRLIHNKIKIPNIKKLLFSVFSIPFLRKLGILMLRSKYAFICRYADKIVLLSDAYISPYAACAGAADSEKFTAIANSLTFDVFADESIISQKEKTVLIVARIDENSKRISLALKIWQRIERQLFFSDWKLVIIGTGDDEEYCKKLARKLRLKNCVFEGRQNPLDYYKRASIYMMTSSNEGFGLTMTEAQQMGVVPIAFDCFGAVHDIIEHNRNGLLVPEKNIKEYVRQMTSLMQDVSLRQTLARNAVHDCQKFALEKIVQQWIELFEGK
jgi:glycosyltransferase involved in cell wall biosynthesis